MKVIELLQTILFTCAIAGIGVVAGIKYEKSKHKEVEPKERMYQSYCLGQLSILTIMNDFKDFSERDKKILYYKLDLKRFSDSLYYFNVNK